MNKPEPITTIICHFPKDNCGYCKDGIPHRHKTDRYNPAAAEQRHEMTRVYLER